MVIGSPPPTKIFTIHQLSLGVKVLIMESRSGVVLLTIFFLSFGAISATGVEETSTGSGGDYLSVSHMTTYGSFYEDPSSSITYSFTSGLDDRSVQYSQYIEYYISSDEAPPEGTIRTFQLGGNEPVVLYLAGQSIPYADYQSTAIYSGANSLWIEGDFSWTQYAVCPLGGWLRLITNSPLGGTADVYKITPSGRVEKYSNWIGTYSTMSFHAEEIGRYFLFFVVNNQPSNLVIIEVGESWTPPPGLITPPSTPATPSPTSGDVTVTIKSEGMRGYEVYVDGVYVGKDGWGGDALDGKYVLKVTGNQWHTVRVFDGQWFYGKSKYYQRKQTYILRVEPATTGYSFGIKSTLS
jgi:hypothetical protein